LTIDLNQGQHLIKKSHY